MIQTPIQYFGNKRNIALEIWKRFGDVDKYIDSFSGSLSILLNRPHQLNRGQIEVVNDSNSALINMWRAMRFAPYDLANATRDIPRASLSAWAYASLIQKSRDDLFHKLFSDVKYYDLELAAAYLFLNANQMIKPYEGGSWGEKDGRMEKVYSGNDPRGFKKSMINVNDKMFYNINIEEQVSHYKELSKRIENVIILCGDWELTVGSPTAIAGGNINGNWKTGIVFDPPYEGEDHDMELYVTYQEGISKKVRDKALELGEDPRLRIALCGYVEEHDKHIPDTWERLYWTAGIGFGSLRKDKSNTNRFKEVIWFSPHCIKVRDDVVMQKTEQGTLF